MSIVMNAPYGGGGVAVGPRDPSYREPATGDGDYYGGGAFIRDASALAGDDEDRYGTSGDDGSNDVEGGGDSIESGGNGAVGDAGRMARERAEREGRRRRRTEPLGPRDTFLPLVSPARRPRQAASVDERRQQQRGPTNGTSGARPHPFVRRYAGTSLTSENPHYQFEFRSRDGREVWFATPGHVRARLLAMPTSELQRAIAYALEHGLIANPGNFERFEDLRDANGGRDILLHEVFKEPQDTLDALYQVAGRVTWPHQKRGSVPTGGVVASILRSGGLSPEGLVVDGAGRRLGADRQATAGAAKEIPFRLIRRQYDPETAPRVPRFNPVNVGDPVTLLANMGYPNNDPLVYVQEPARVVLGIADGNPQIAHDLCGKAFDAWFRRTARETDDTPELNAWAEERMRIAKERRALCPVEGDTVDVIGQMLRDGMALDQRAPMDPRTFSNLRTAGYTPEQIERLWGRGAPRAEAAPTPSASA
jgi:hypothetical protein